MVNATNATAFAADVGFEFSDADFERIRQLIYRHAGIALSDNKRQLAYSRVGRRLRARGLTRFADYLDIVEAGDAAEMEAFTNALTTNLTAFFREAHHFPILAEHARRIGARREVTLWCAACSTGEEPYSMAMTLVETLGTNPPARILASDVDTNVLAKAQRGVYPLAALEKVPEQQARKFFLKGTGAKDGAVRVRPELQALITYRQINLLHDRWPVRGPFDAIFCRNVMIYFDKATQRRILERFAPLLAPDGLLFAGHSENFHHAADLFRPRGKTVYQPAGARKPAHA
ncbi:MAG TPA: CheR family methyltransferase [Burkholderiales bacterium]|nr:CheR family methyltransferase [Burkholderiales bacterium]